MAKVLISFLGTGRLIDKSKREYDPVNYYLDNVDLGKYSFVGAALKEHFQMNMQKDKIILIGSIHSMWEEIYRLFTPATEFNEDTHVDLGVFCDDANSKSELNTFKYKETVERSLGKNSHIVLIKYGVDDEEIQENLKIIIGIQKFLNPGDELIVDVTHSFRSLPIYIMQLLIFLKNIKNITISHIYYGMFEMKSELGYAPIVDLTSILSVNDWIIAAYNFKEFGNTYKIVNLLKAQNKLFEAENKEKDDIKNKKTENEEKTNLSYNDVIEPLLKFAEIKNLNYISDFKSQIQGLLPLRNPEKMPELGRLVVTPIIKDFLKDFQGDIPYSTFQYRMAKWHNNHHNYGYALMLLVEACVTYCCEELMIDYDNFEERNLTKNAMVFSDDQKSKKKVIDRRIDIIRAFDSLYSIDTGNNPEESYFDTFILGRADKGVNKYTESYYIKYDSLIERSNGNVNVKTEKRDSYGNGFKTQNANRNLIAHNVEGKKSYSRIIAELKAGIELLKEYLDPLIIKKDI